MSDDQELFDTIAAEPKEPVDLTVLKEKASELRDSYLEKTETIERLNKIQQRIQEIERKELVDMFSEAKVSSVTVEADGNHPAFVAERSTVYGAKIPDELRQQAFEWFESQGHGDLIKSTINIVFGMQEHERRLAVMKLLSDNGVEFWTDESVHHMTLKAFVKREIVAGRIVPHDLLGVFVFDEVKIK